jgi:hypothetical protein
LLAIEPIVLSLGNVAVFDALIAQEALNDEQQRLNIFYHGWNNQPKALISI